MINWFKKPVPPTLRQHMEKKLVEYDETIYNTELQLIEVASRLDMLQRSRQYLREQLQAEPDKVRLAAVP